MDHEFPILSRDVINDLIVQYYLYLNAFCLKNGNTKGTLNYGFLKSGTRVRISPPSLHLNFCVKNNM